MGGFVMPVQQSGMVAGNMGMGGFGMPVQQSGMAVGNTGMGCFGMPVQQSSMAVGMGGFAMPMQQSGQCGGCMSGCSGYSGSPNGSMQMATPYPSGGCTSQMGVETKANGGGQGAGDLYDRAMIGVSNLGFEQRK